jgi:hypothetical protein
LKLIDPTFLKSIRDLTATSEKSASIVKDISGKFQIHASDFMNRLQNYTSTNADTGKIIDYTMKKFRYLIQINDLDSLFEIKSSASIRAAFDFLNKNSPSPSLLAIWLSVSKIGQLQDENYTSIISLSWLDEFLLSKLIEQSLQHEGYDEYSSSRLILLIKILILIPNWLEEYNNNPGSAIQSLFQYQEIQKYIMINKYQDILYFHYESLIELLAAFYASAVLDISLRDKTKKTEIKKKLVDWHSEIEKLIKVAGKNSCKVYPTIDAIIDIEVSNNK